MDEERKPFDELLRQIFGPSLHAEGDEDLERADLSEEAFALADAEDLEILMHRDAHFGGRFEVMLEYYREGGKGVSEELLPERIVELAQLQDSSGQDLAAYLLTGPEAERVARARATYKALSDIYDVEDTENSHPKLLADLILSEDEEAEEEIKAIVAEGSTIVPLLVQLLRADDFHDPLYPGYGQAPALAARCIGLIGDTSSIPVLFEAMGAGDFFAEEDVVHALKDIGPEAKKFLLKVLILRPLTHDNENAARALTHFVPDSEVAEHCLNQLDDPEIATHPNLVAYLVLCCEGLQKEADRQRFIALKQRPDLQNLDKDMAVIAKSWAS